MEWFGGGMETIKRYYRMDRRDIHLLRFLLEAYDGISGLTTVDAKAGLVVLRVAPGCEADLASLILELQQEILIQPVEDAGGSDSGRSVGSAWLA